MKNYVKYLGLFLVVAGAALLVFGQVNEMSTNNLLNLGSVGIMIGGVIAYICAGKYMK